MRIVVSGLLGQYSFGGVIWDYIQYMLGFRALGHDVWYLEDSGAWPYDPIADSVSADCSHNVAVLTALMEDFGFGDRWIYRNGADGKFHGAGEAAARDIIKNADIFANVSGAAFLTDYDLGSCHLMFLDGDPMFCQTGLASEPKSDYTKWVRSHHSHFTFGLNVNGFDTHIPPTGLDWKTTVQPISLEHWPYTEDETRDEYTTVMNWASYKPREWKGRTYGQKDLEFDKFKTLPQMTPQQLSIAMGQGIGRQRPTEELRSLGWNLLEAGEAVADYRRYHEFLRGSKAEWSIAKNGYVRGKTGWFSCRSACYLALGRPVLVQNTGWTRYLPSGEGVLAFDSMEDICRGILSINTHYDKHRRAARRFAEAHLDAPKVCQNLLDQIN